MERMEALKYVLQDNGFSAEEKASAREALEDISISAATSHERDTASYVLKSIDGLATDKPIPENILELLELVGATVQDWREISEHR